MTFSQEWERLYAVQKHVSVWPWSDLVSFVMRHCRLTAGVRVLEMGCGAGANIPFFQSLGARYFAIEGSPTVVERLKAVYPDYADQIVVGDFTMEIPFVERFDLIVDRGSLTHNTTSSIRRGVGLIDEWLKPGGALIGIDWFSTDFSEMANGTPDEDDFSRRGFATGNLAGVGIAHFSDEIHLRELLSAFEIAALEHKTVVRREPDDGWVYAAWNFVAKKRQE